MTPLPTPGTTIGNDLLSFIQSRLRSFLSTQQQNLGSPLTVPSLLLSDEAKNRPVQQASSSLLPSPAPVEGFSNDEWDENLRQRLLTVMLTFNLSQKKVAELAGLLTSHQQGTAAEMIHSFVQGKTCV
jgi:hypothetical protein